MDINEIKDKKSGTKKTYEYVFEYFSEQIISGKLMINDKIPTEREIAEADQVTTINVKTGEQTA